MSVAAVPTRVGVGGVKVIFGTFLKGEMKINKHRRAISQIVTLALL